MTARVKVNTMDIVKRCDAVAMTVLATTAQLSEYVTPTIARSDLSGVIAGSTGSDSDDIGGGRDLAAPRRRAPPRGGQ